MMLFNRRKRSQGDFLGLSGVSKTLLIPLFCRFLEAKRLHRARFMDHDAIRIVEALGGESVVRQLATKPFWMFTHQWVGNRTVYIDQWITGILEQNQDSQIIQVLNFGAGLCSRYARTVNSLKTKNPNIVCRLNWFEIDLEQVKGAWNRFYSETEHHHFLALSILDENALKAFFDHELVNLAPRRIAVLEGLLMYLDSDQVAHVFNKVLPSLGVTDVFFESLLSPTAKLAKLNNRFTGFDLTMKWDMAGSSDFDRAFSNAGKGGYKIVDQKWVSPVAKVFHAKFISD